MGAILGLLTKVVPLIQMVKPLLFGKKEQVVTGGGHGAGIREVFTKGLIQSKTANVAHAQVVGSVLAIWMTPIPKSIQWMLTGIAVLIWAKDIILRIITKDKVG